ncbi:hypothetical protein [Krasilnikovia sp. MM14-A1259]|uniref:hypothetical protein n=1 Tax=Krasilnikovia sp. MM14-A1259 TaxID=3373539 RepID=UPI0038250468
MASAERAWAGAGRIAGPADVARVIAEVNAAGLGRDRTAALARSVATADDVALTGPDASRTLPVLPELAGLFPAGGLRRGSVITATGSTSLLMALIAPVVAAGSWAAVAGMPGFGVLAAITDYGIDSGRLALVPAPGPDWPTVVAALLDGVDLVVAATPGGPPADAVVRSLAARARQRGSVLIAASPWTGTDLTVELVDRQWIGLGAGRGRLRRQEVILRATGRGRAARPRTATFTLPPNEGVLQPMPQPADGPDVGQVSVAAVPPALRCFEAVSQAPAEVPADLQRHEVAPPADPWGPLVRSVPRPERRKRR